MFYKLRAGHAVGRLGVSLSSIDAARWEVCVDVGVNRGFTPQECAVMFVAVLPSSAVPDGLDQHALYHKLIGDWISSRKLRPAVLAELLLALKHCIELKPDYKLSSFQVYLVSLGKVMENPGSVMRSLGL